MFSHFCSIRIKLLVTTLLISLLSLFIILSIWYSSLKREAKETTVNDMKTIIEISNTSFERQLQDIINVTALSTVRSSNNLSTNIINIMSRDNLTDAEIVAYRREAQDYLVSLCCFKEYLKGLMLSDNHGNNTVTYGIVTSYDYLSEQHYLDMPDTSSDMFFIKPHYARQWYNNENDLVFSLLRPVYNFNDERIGFAITDITCQLFKNSYELGSENPFSLYVIDPSTREVVFTPNHNILSLETGSLFDADIISRMSGSSGDFFVPLMDENMLIVYHKSELTGWYTLNMIPESHIISAFSKVSRINFLITIVLVILLSLMIYMFCTYLTNNIVTLTNAVERIGIDGLFADIDVRANDEVGTLAEQFQNMLARIRQLVTKVKEEETRKREAEISALQYQMNPHFLYNSLNTIKFLAQLQNSDNIATVTEALSSLMHISMKSAPFVRVADDMEFLNSYLLIQNYRDMGYYQHEIEAEPGLSDFLLPKLLTQPLVENALKHGLSQKPSGGVVHVSYFRDGEKLVVRVSDNGIGMSEAKIAEVLSRNHSANAGHIGIYNIKERIHLYFGDGFGIQIQSQENLYTRFEVTLPLLTETDGVNNEKNTAC